MRWRIKGAWSRIRATTVMMYWQWLSKLGWKASFRARIKNGIGQIRKRKSKSGAMKGQNERVDDGDMYDLSNV
jgi:hypothetical protein